MGNLQSFEREGAISKADFDRLERRLKKIGRGRAEVARSDLRSVEGLARNPFMERIFQIYDTDNDGLLTLPDMKKMMELFTSLRSEEMRCRFAFFVFDADNDGFIDREELMSVLQLTNKRQMTAAQLGQIVDSMMARWDSSGQGRLQYPDFKDMLSTTLSNLSL